jgi:hypothetical protein
MDDKELARRAHELPGRFADRISPKTFEHVQGAARGGEWDEEIDILLAGLQKGDSAISAEERDEIKALLDAMGEPSDRLDQLTVTD